MAHKTASDPSRHPEFAVNRETISSFFNPPLAKSTFYDMVSSGKVVAMKGIKGMYLLNQSLKRLGLREVSALPEKKSSRSMKEIIRLAFSLLDPAIFPTPSWVIFSEETPFRDQQQAEELAELFREDLESLKSPAERVQFLAGVLDGYHDLEIRRFKV